MNKNISSVQGKASAIKPEAITPEAIKVEGGKKSAVKGKARSFVEKRPDLIFAGDVKGQSGIKIGESKFDPGMPMSQLSNIDEYRAVNQGLGEAFVNGFISRAISILPKFTGGFGYVSGALPWLASGDISKMTKNPLSIGMEQFDEFLRESLPVYASKNYNADNIFDVMSSSKFWFDDLFDGIAFATSAYIPGGAVGKISKLIGTAGKALGTTAKGAKMISAANQLKAANPFIMTAYNTVSEAGFEARDSQKHVFEKLIADGVDEKIARERAAIAAANTFYANAAVLLGPNFIQSKFMLGGFKKNVDGLKSLITSNAKTAKKLIKSPVKAAFKNTALGIVSEGLWEEGMQTAIQNYEMRQAEDPEIKQKNILASMSDYGEQWVSNLSTVEGQKSMILGGIIGGFMGAYSGALSTLTENKYISDFGEDWKEHITGYVNKWDKTFQDRVGDINDPNGTPNQEKTIKSIYQTIKDKDLFNEATAAALNGDEFHDKFNKRMAIARYMWNFFSDKKHFDSTEEALQFAITRLEHMAEQDGADKAEFEKFKEDAAKIKEAYDEVEKKNTRFENLDSSEEGIIFNSKAKKSMLFEQMKRDVLSEMKGDLPSDQSEAIDNIIEDSQKKTNYLSNTKTRKEAFEKYEEVQDNFASTLEGAIERNKILGELKKGVDPATKEPYTEEQIKEKKKKLNELSYDLLEQGIINGTMSKGDLDMVTDDLAMSVPEEVREKRSIGLRDVSNYQLGMAYKKKAARDKTYADYKQGNATADDVFNSIINNSNEQSAPYTKEDEKVLTELLAELERSSNPELKEEALRTQEYLNLLKANPEMPKETFFPEVGEYEKKVKNLNAYIESQKLIPKVGGVLTNNTFEDLDSNKVRRTSEEELQNEAMNLVIDKKTNPVVSSFKSNPDSFSDVNSVEDALQSLEKVEDGLHAEKRKSLKESPKGKAIQKKIDKLREELNKMLEHAQKNKNNKVVADENSKRNYGETMYEMLNDQEILDHLNKYFDDKATEIFKDAKEDDLNFMHLQRLSLMFKDLSDEDKTAVLSVIKSRKSELIEEFKKEFFEHVRAIARKDIDEEIAKNPGNATNLNKLFDSEFAPGRTLERKLNRWAANPSSNFMILITESSLYQEDAEGTSPVDSFIVNANVGEFYNAMKAFPEDQSTKLHRLNKEDTMKFVKMHMLIESIDSFEASLESNMDPKAMLDGELNDYLLAEKGDTEIAPSRQQRISIFELIRWFKSKNRTKTGLGAVAYLRGLAGTGKTTVVAKLFLKLSGISASDIVAAGNNKSSTKTLNDSLGSSGTKDYTQISPEDLTDAKILFLDEVGAMNRDGFLRVLGYVEEENNRRRDEGIDELKVVAMGDPNQLRPAADISIPIEDSRIENTDDVTHITPLTIPFRSNVSSILDLQDAYHMSINEVAGITVKASAELGVEATGVHVGQTDDQLLNQLFVHKDNGKSKVVIVGRDTEVDAMEIAILSKISNARIVKANEEIPEGEGPVIEVLAYEDVQGRTFEEVFVAIDPTIEQVKTNMNINQKIEKNRARNKIMYTATSRAQSYVFMLDHTGMKNKTSTVVKTSEESAKKDLKKYKKQYKKDVKKDIAILNDDFLPEEPEPKPTPPPPGPEDETPEEEEPPGPEKPEPEEPEVPEEDEVEPVEEDEDLEPEDIVPGPEVDSTDLDITLDEYEDSETDGIHNITHTKNRSVQDSKSKLGVKMEGVEKGDQVVYVRVKKNKKEYIHIYVKKGRNHYVEVGVLDPTETEKVFGITYDELKARAKSAIRTPAGAKFGIDNIDNHIVATGTVNATPLPLSYGFVKTAKKGLDIIENAFKKVRNLFEPKGFKINGYKLHIYNSKDAGKLREKGIRAGIPYLIINITSKEGKDVTQHVKLAPRMINRTDDNSYIAPIENFLDAIEEIEKETGLKMGSTELNRLIHLFKNDFKVSEDGTIIEPKQTKVVTFEAAKQIIPGLTKEMFDNIKDSSVPKVINGYFGITKINRVFTEEEFNEQYASNPLYMEKSGEDTPDGETWFVNKDTEVFYKWNERTGNVETKEIFINEKNQLAFVEGGIVDPEDGHRHAHVRQAGLKEMEGEAQQAINQLSKNNASPNGVAIRVTKKIKGPSGKTMLYTSGKSLLSGEVSLSEYIGFIRKLAKLNELNIKKFDLKNPDRLKIVEETLIQNNLITAEDLQKVKEGTTVAALTSESVRKAMGFEGGSSQETSESLRRPLKMDEFNKLGKDPEKNNEELTGLLESHFEKVVPTTVQVQTDPLVKDEVTKKPKKESTDEQSLDDIMDELNDDRINDELDNLDDRRLLVPEEGMKLGKKLTKAEAMKIIKKSIPNIKEEQVQFVEDLAEMEFADEGALGAFFNGVIYLQQGKDGAVYERVVKHEAFHKIWRENLTKNERNRLKQAFSNEFPETKAHTPVQFEEFVAIKYQEWKKGDYITGNNFIKKFFAKLRDFFDFVGNNRDFIESAFKNIESGAFVRRGFRSLEGSSLKLRREFQTTEMFVSAISVIRKKLLEVSINGLEGYPVSKYELEATVEAGIYRSMQAAYTSYNKARAIYEKMLQQPESEEREAKLEKIREVIKVRANYAKMLSITYKNFKDVFKIAYPNWDVKSLMDAEDLLDEVDEFSIEDSKYIGEEVSVADDIIDWNKVDMEGKISSIAKQFLANIRMPSGKYMKPRTAYKIALDLTQNLQESEEHSLSEQLKARIDKETNPYILAVGTTFIRLLENTEDLKIIEINERGDTSYSSEDARSDGMFLNDGTFVYLTDPEQIKNESITDYKGLAQLNRAGIKYKIIKRSEIKKKAITKTFIDDIITETDYSKKELLALFQNYQNRDGLRSVMSNFLSQRQRNIKVIEVVDVNGVRRIVYKSAIGAKSYNTVRSSIREALLSLNSLEKAQRLSKKIKDKIDSYGGDKNVNEKEVIQFLLQELGLAHLAENMELAKPKQINDAYQKIDYIFANSNVFEDVFEEVDSSTVGIEDLDADEITDMTADEKDKVYQQRLRKQTSVLLNNLATVVNDKFNNLRAQSVKSSGGEKKYLHVLGGQAHSVLNSILTNLKGGKKYLQKFLRNNYYKKNIFISGKNTIYEVEDFDGTTETNEWGREQVTEYKDEKFKNYVERSFASQFLQSIAEITNKTSKLLYSQNLFTISNKPANISAKIEALDPKRAKDALKDMVIQLTTLKDLKVVRGDRNRLVNLNAIAEAIEVVMPGSLKELDPNKEFTHYELNSEVLDKIDDTVAAKIAKEAYKIIINNSSDFMDKFETSDIEYPVHSISYGRLQELIDTEIFKDYDTEELSYAREIDPYTGKSKRKESGEKIRTLKFKETPLDVINRVNKYLKAEGRNEIVSNLAEIRGLFDQTENEWMAESQKLIPRELIEPIVGAFLVNDYINSRQLTELISGPMGLYKSANDMTKRLSGSSAPGLRGLVDPNLGMPEKTNVVILKDEEFTVGKTIKETLREGFGLSEEDINDLLPLFGKDSDIFEYTDAQGFMLPERFEDIKAGFGLTYGAGATLKPAYFHVDEDGATRMLKYSSVVLTDELVAKSPVLYQLREKMRYGGKDGNQIIGEVVFQSGNKVGQPLNQPRVNDLLLTDEEIEGENLNRIKTGKAPITNYLDTGTDGFEIHNIDYRLQLNPLHSVDASVANPTQLGHFLNTEELNAGRAKSLYRALSRIINNNQQDFEDETSTAKAFIALIKRKLSSGTTNQRPSEIFEALSEDIQRVKSDQLSEDRKDKKRILTPWNFPTIAEKISIQISSYINKNVLQVRFKGAKMVLQTAFGTELLREDREEIERAAARLNYRTNPDTGVLYSEAIIPQGLLPESIEEKIKEALKIREKDPTYEIPEMYLYGDLLGFRIPSSELHSSIPLKVAGFYETLNTNIIIVPKEVVAFHGSDYDIDALYVIQREWDKKEDKPIGYIFDTDEKRWEFDHEFEDKPAFINASRQEQNRYYKNLIIERFMETITDPKNRKRMAKPISLLRIKNDIAKILGMKPGGKRRKNDSSNILDRQKTHASSFEALQGVGIFANAIKSLSYSMRSNVNGTQPTIRETAEDEPTNAITYMGVDMTEMINNEELWDDLDAFLNSAIDNVREQDLPNLNMTGDNIKAYVALRAFGVGGSEALEISNRVFSQNFVEYLNKKTGFNTTADLIKRFENIMPVDSIENLEGGIPSKKILEALLKKDYSVEDLLSKLEEGISINEDEMAWLVKQYQVLKEYNKAMIIGKDLAKLAKLLNVVKQMPVLKHEIEDVLSAKKSIFNVDKETGEINGTNDKFLIKIDEILDRLPHVKEALDIVEKSNTLLESKFYRYNEKIRNTVKSIYNQINVKFNEKSKSLIKQRQTDEFMKIIISGVKWDPLYNGFKSEPKRTSFNKKVLSGEEAFLDRITTAVNILKKDDTLKKNPFIAELSIGRNGQGERVIRFDAGGNMDYADIIDYENAFEQLANIEIIDGKVVEKQLIPDKFNQGYSKLQKDFLRYLILRDGLMYTKSNFAEIMPLRIMTIFQRAFETDMEKLIADKNALKSIKDLFMIQLVVKNPSSIPKRIRANDKIIRNQTNPYLKYVVDTEDVYADFTVAFIRDEDGEINWSATYGKFPAYAKGIERTTDAGRTYTVIYRRGTYKKGDNFLTYQKVANNSLSGIYSTTNNKDAVNYDAEKAFRTDIRNIRQKEHTPNSDGSKIITIPQQLIHGRIISLTSHSDPARQDPRFYKVMTSKKVTREDGSEAIEYRLESVEEPPYTTKKESDKVFDKEKEEKEDAIIQKKLEAGFGTEFIPEIKGTKNITKSKKVGSPKRTGIVYDIDKQLERIVDSGSSLAKIAKMVRAKNAGMVSREATMKTGGVVITRMKFRNDLSYIYEVLVNKSIAEGPEHIFDEVLIHEEIHRYTTTLIWKYQTLDNPKESMSSEEYEFVKRIDLLWKDYKKNQFRDFYAAGEIFNNLDEFLAYGLTNPEFIEYLKNTKMSEDASRSLLNDLINAIIKLLGGDPSIYAVLEKSFEDMIQYLPLAIPTTFEGAQLSTEDIIASKTEKKENTEEDAMEHAKLCGL